MANDIGGVWRTIGGRRVFIKDGQSLGEAMKKSGKFKKAERLKEMKKVQREESDIASELSKRASSFEERQELEKGYKEYKKKNPDGTLDDYMQERHLEKMGQKAKEKDKKTAKLEKYTIEEVQAMAKKEGILTSEMQDRLGLSDKDLGLDDDEYTKNFERDIQEKARYVKAEEAKQSTKSRDEKLKKMYEDKSIKPYSKEDYERRDLMLQKRVDEGLITKGEAEIEKARQAWKRDEITRDEFDKVRERYEKQDRSAGKKKVDKNDTEALKRIADSGENINNYEGLDDIAKDYIENRRKETKTTSRINDFKEHNQKLESERIADDPRKAIDYYLKKGDFGKADKYMKDYGLEDEREEFKGGLNSGMQSEYEKYRNRQIRNAWMQYLQDHPNSKLSFNDFKKTY